MGEEITKPTCASCGADLEPGDRFCDQCGEEVQGSGFKVQGSGFEVQGSGEEVQGSGFKVQGLEEGETEVEGEGGDTGYGIRDAGDGRSSAVPAEKEGGRESSECGVRSAELEGETGKEIERRTSNIERPTLNPPRRASPEPRTLNPPRWASPEPRTLNLHPTSSESDCPFFRLEHNEARVFVEGRPSSFNFRLTALGEEALRARNICLHLDFGNGSACLEQRLRYSFGMFVKQHQINVPHQPECAGVGIHAEVVLRFDLDGRPHRYGTNIQWNCISPVNQGKALENLVINLKADANYAADQNIRLLENLGAANHEGLGAELEKLDLEPRWSPLPLSELEGMSLIHSLPPVEAGGLSVRTLHLPGGIRVHLVHAPRTTLGRQKECNTLPIRVFDPEGALIRHESKRISRIHTAFLLDQSGLRVADGDGLGQRSTAGTFLDGKPLGAEGVLLGSRKNHALGLGSPDPTALSTFRVRTGVANDWIRRVQWALLRRQDGFASRELFLLLDGACSLREVQADLPDLDLSRTVTGFEVCSGGRRVEFDLAGNDPCSGLRFTPYQPLGIQL